MIIGAMKSGTTTLHCILAQHPKVVSGKRKELNYFKQAKQTSVADYEALFPNLDKQRHTFTLDSSPNYTKSERWGSAPWQIASLPGCKKLVYILRNPIERMDSHVAHNIAQGRWSIDSWQVELAHLLDVSTYARHIARYEEAGLLNDMLVLDFADLCANPVDVAYRVHDFLGLKRIEPTSVKKRNVRKVNVRVLQHVQVDDLRARLRDDVELLVSRYGFAGALNWKVL